MIEITEDGIVISSNDVHSMKVWFPIDVIDEGIVIWVNDSQFSKILSLKDVNEDGCANAILCNESQ